MPRLLTPVVVVVVVVASLGCGPAPAQRGETCRSSDPVTGSSSVPCAAGLVCVDDTEGAANTHAICVPPTNREQGEPCASSNECASGLTCSGSAPGAAPFCA